MIFDEGPLSVGFFANTRGGGRSSAHINAGCHRLLISPAVESEKGSRRGNGSDEKSGLDIGRAEREREGGKTISQQLPKLGNIMSDSGVCREEERTRRRRTTVRSLVFL